MYVMYKPINVHVAIATSLFCERIGTCSLYKISFTNFISGVILIYNIKLSIMIAEKNEIVGLLTNNNDDDSFCDDVISVKLLARTLPKRSNNAGLSDNMALTNLIKGLIGTGILSLPMGFLNAGLLTGFVLILFVNFVNVYCMHQLVKCAQRFCTITGRESISYGDVAELSLQYGPMPLRSYSQIGRSFVNFIIIATQLGFCCVYFVFIGTNLQQVFDQGENRSISIFIAVVFLPMLVLCSIRDLKSLAIISTLANVLFVIGFAITFFYMFSTFKEKDPKPLPNFSSWSSLPLFFGTAMFAFEAISLVLPIENKMKHPESFLKWNGVMNVGCLIVTVFYLSVGFFGYLRFGADVKDSITLNLPKDQTLYLAVRVIFASAVFLTYPIQFYVPIEIVSKFINERCRDKKRNSLFYEYLARFLMVFFTFLTAELIPKLSLFISLVGSFTASALALIFPPLIETLTLWSCKDTKRTRLVIKNVTICLYGCLGLTFGTYASVAAIVEAFKI